MRLLPRKKLLNKNSLQQHNFMLNFFTKQYFKFSTRRYYNQTMWAKSDRLNNLNAVSHNSEPLNDYSTQEIREHTSIHLGANCLILYESVTFFAPNNHGQLVWNYKCIFKSDCQSAMTTLCHIKLSQSQTNTHTRTSDVYALHIYLLPTYGRTTVTYKHLTRTNLSLLMRTRWYIICIRWLVHILPKENACF